MYRYILNVVIVAIAFMLPAFYNGYIIPSADAGTYIEAAMANTYPADRPVFYAWLLKLMSLGATLWLAVAFQCVVLAIAFTDFVRVLLPRISLVLLAALAVSVSVFTPAGWFACQLMPDILTPVLFLSIINYITATRKHARIGYLLLMFIAAICHNSHLIVLSSFVLVLLLIRLFGYKALTTKHILSITVISLAAWFTVSVPNYFRYNKFVPSVYSHVFIMGKLVENKLVNRYLNDHCNTENLQYCAYKNSLGNHAWEFVWSAESPMQQLGGWDACRKENEQIISGILSDVHYYPYLASSAANDTWRQLLQVEIDRSYELPWFVYDSETPIYKVINTYFPKEIKQLEACRVNKHTFHTALLSNVYIYVILLSTIAAVFLYKFTDGRFLAIYIAVVLYLIINAFVTANFANVLSRLNARAIWLLPCVNFILLAKVLIRNKKVN